MIDLMRAILVASVVFLTACSTASHIVTGTVRPPISAESVRVYRQPPPEYEEIALLRATGENSLAITEQGEMDDVIGDLKEEAAALGANGVLITSLGSGSQVVGVPVHGGGTIVSSEDHAVINAIAIHVTAE